MQLVERGKLELDAPVARYLPAFAQHGKEQVTLRHLLTHMSGLRPGIPATPPWSGTAAAIERACAEKLQNAPGSTFVYSDINFILLGELVHLASGRTLDVYTRDEIFRPLKMSDSGFLPPADRLARIAPTELVEGKMIHGVVHDPTSRRMGGVAGHAGLFLTTADLARFCRMLINGGELDGQRILSPASIAEMTRVQNDGSSRRGLGWDIDTSYSGPRGRWLPAGSTYGHTGWTGTSVWIDPAARTFIIFFINRVHPDGKGDAIPIRREIATLAAEAMGRDSGAVLNGIDVLVRVDFARLRGLRIGLITNHSGRDRQGRQTIDLLHSAKDVKLVALFSPEHGIRGAADDKVDDTVDEKTKLPVYSLYGVGP
jgi:CubicO group peptidase (beta-lactamase class C family)